MNIYDFAPIRILISAAYWIVIRLNDLLEPLVGSPSAALAIVVVTIAIRALLIPVGRSQVKAGVTRQRLAPKIADLQKRYQKKPEVLQQKMMELYAEEKASPMAGCLPVLAQMPVLMAVYGLFILPEIGSQPNELLRHSLLGIPLDASLLGLIGSGSVTWQTVGVYATIMIVISVVAQASRQLLMPASPPSGEQQPGSPDLSGLTRIMSFMPFMTAIFAAFVPLAAALYLVTTTTWTLGERLVLNRIYGVTSPNKS